MNNHSFELLKLLLLWLLCFIGFIIYSYFVIVGYEYDGKTFFELIVF